MITTESMTLYEYLKKVYDKDKLHTLMMALQEEGGSPDLTAHLARWAKNKNHIFQMFGCKLRIEKPVTSSISNNTAYDMIRDFVQKHLAPTRKAALAKLFLMNKLETAEIIQNTLKSDHTFFGAKFSKGMKVSRVLGRLVPSTIAHEIQTAFSMLVQKFTVQGTAVLSIDPIDYLTMSTNRSGWRSCHALDGEYRTGTLAYMMDVSTAIAYVTNTTVKDSIYVNGDIKQYSYDSKMWRQVVLFPTEKSKNQFAVQSRQYPNTSTNNSSAIAELIRQALTNRIGGHGDLLSENLEAFKTDRVPTEDLVNLVEDATSDGLWYNDISHSAFSTGRLTYPSIYNDAEEFLGSDYSPALVGTSVQCACGCGSYLDESEYLYIESSEDRDYDEDYYEED